MSKKIFSRLFPYDRQSPGYWLILGCLWGTATLADAFERGFSLSLLPTGVMSLFSFSIAAYALPKHK